VPDGVHASDLKEWSVVAQSDLFKELPEPFFGLRAGTSVVWTPTRKDLFGSPALK